MARRPYNWKARQGDPALRKDDTRSKNTANQCKRLTSNEKKKLRKIVKTKELKKKVTLTEIMIIINVDV